MITAFQRSAFQDNAFQIGVGAAGDLTTLANVKQWLGVTGLGIASISNASPAVVVLISRPTTPLLNGGDYNIEGAIGMVGIDGTWPISVLSPTSFSVPFNAVSAGTYTGGAVVGMSDALLQRLITAASTAVQTWLNRTIAQAQYTELRDGQNMAVMLFKNYPVSAVASLAINDSPVAARSASAPGYVFDANRLMLTGQIFPRGFQNVQVVYTAGYATTPADVEQATIDIIGDWFKYRDRIGIASMGIDGQSISMTAFLNKQMPARARFVLEQYRRVAPIR